MSAFSRSSGSYAVAFEAPEGQFALFDENLRPIADAQPDAVAPTGRPMSPWERAEAYFDDNPAFLSAIERAAGVMQRRCEKVSARFIIEFARWLRFMSWDGMMELLECFSALRIVGEEVAAIPNAYSAYITRYLESKGYAVTKARSVMDDA